MVYSTGYSSLKGRSSKRARVGEGEMSEQSSRNLESKVGRMDNFPLENEYL